MEEEGRAHGKGPITELVRGSKTPISTFGELTLKHCNGGATMQAALWLKEHLKNGGKLVVTIAGALSSFQVGVTLASLFAKEKSTLSRPRPRTTRSPTTAMSRIRTMPTFPATPSSRLSRRRNCAMRDCVVSPIRSCRRMKAYASWSHIF